MVIHKKHTPIDSREAVWTLKFVRIDLVSSKEDDHANTDVNSQDSYQIDKLGLKLKSLGLERSISEGEHT